MYFLLFSVLIFTCFLLGYIHYDSIVSKEWMDRKFTTVIKGFSILTVLWAHIGAKFGIGGIQFIAGIGVALFLVCSGYGLEISYGKNGLGYFWRKRLLKVCIPFWIVESVGLIVTGKFYLNVYILDMFFIMPATAYGWFMRYIVICYIIFYMVKIISNKLKLAKPNEIWLLLILFSTWFVVESLFFANPDMPFLEARQMLSFPLVIIIAKYVKIQINYHYLKIYC